MPYVSEPGAVHADDCPRIAPDVDAVRYVSDLPDGLSAGGCDRCGT
jgi:hypothetical protein